ncbi:unnamed protein product [Schistosoma mattheei]|uniref:XPG N-terminal domain-containing protein n=1 Tax=Schistosoma mattheei TaxID=31246 RepID=A0AA85AV80_9TREM|nr:unnamed protein product [Schistosoma mattheei]
MGVRGLTTYLQSDPRNFTEYQLHNTTVIIDGLNFLNFLYFDSGLYTQFNGEYLAFSGVIHRFINTLKRCNINPIFVLDGCHDHFKLNTQMKRNYQRMQTCRQLLNSIKHNQLSSTHSLYNVQLLPPLTIITFIQILNQLNIHYITCDSEADQNVMNLGIYFKCPIISNDSDFYITIPNHNHNDNPMNNDDDGVSFLPLSLISFKPIINIIPCYSCQKHNQLCMYIKCQKFLINGPGLKNLSINQRSLLACLLGNDYISSNQFIHKLPISFNDKTILFHHHNTMTKQIKLKRRKLIILQLINWLLQFNDNHNDTNLDKPIQCLLNKYPKLQRNQLYHQLMYSIHTYHIHSNLFYLHFNNDLKLFKRIPTFVNKNNIKSDIGCTIGNSSSSSSSSRCSRNTMMKSVTIQQQLSSLNSSYSSEYDKEIDENQILTIKEEDDDVDAEDDSRNTMMKSVTIQQQLSPLNSSYSSEYDKEIDENQIITIEEQEKGGERGEEEENDNDSEDDSRNTMMKSVTIQQQLSSLNSSYSSEYDKEIDENQIITIEEQEKGGERGEEEENDNDSEDDSRNTMIKSVTIQQQLSSLNSSYSSEYDSEIDENQILTIKEEDDDVDAEDDSRDTMMKSVTIQQQLSPLNSSCSSEYDSEIDENEMLPTKEEEHDDDDDHVDRNNNNDDGVNELNEYNTNESIHNNNHNNSYKITTYWPVELLNSFRKYLILPIFLDSILSYGTICLCCIESLYHYSSIYSNTIYLRTLIYNLLLGIESNYTLRYPNQLIGLNQLNNNNNNTLYYIIEYDRKNAFHIKKRKIFVEPIHLLSLCNTPPPPPPPTTTTTTTTTNDNNNSNNNELNIKRDPRLIFLQQYLNLDYHFMELHNDWLISIVLINVLNYKSQSIPLYTTTNTTTDTTNTTSNIDDITQCPISLTFGAICICTYLLTIHSNHHLSFYKLLNKHYYKCANYFLKHIKSLINNKKIVNKKQLNKLNINYVHRYGQLQIIYMTLYTLIHLLDTIVTINQKNQLKTCLNFLSIYFMFPSGYLFHNICHCISFIPSNNNNNNNNNNDSNERYHYVRNVIIKELLNYNHHTNQYLNDAFNLFDQYLQMCNSNPFNHVLNKSLKKFNFINHSKSLKENVIKQDLLPIATTTTPSPPPPPTTTTNKPIQMKMKKIKKKCKLSKNNNKQCKQLSYAEIEEKVRKLMLENGLLD